MGKMYAQNYEEIRSNPCFYGYTSVYLSFSANLKQCSSSVKMSTLLTLAKIDLQKGTSIEELVYSCCKLAPDKELITNLIELGKQNESEEKVIKSVFKFEESCHIGLSCFCLDIVLQAI